MSAQMRNGPGRSAQRTICRAQCRAFPSDDVHCGSRHGGAYALSGLDRELQKYRKSATVIEVVDQMTMRDDSEEIRLYNIANPHVDGMLVGYMPKDDILWVTDMYSPARDARKSPGAVNLYETLKQLGIKPSRLAGGHGGSASYAEFEAVEK
jgi:hypothetical protein